MASLRVSAFSVTRLFPLLRGNVRHASAKVSRGVRSSQDLSWARYSALRSKWRSVSTEVEEEEGQGTQQGGHERLQLSDSCIKHLLRVTEGDESAMLRIIVEGGGCSGFQYKFELDRKIKPDDRVFERGGAKVVIDELSLSFLSGSTVDYHQELIRSSFRITDNPNAELGCSCGASFALK